MVTLVTDPQVGNFPAPNEHVYRYPSIITITVYKAEQKLHPKSHQRARKSLSNRLRLLPRHLNNAEQPLNANA